MKEEIIIGGERYRGIPVTLFGALGEWAPLLTLTYREVINSPDGAVERIEVGHTNTVIHTVVRPDQDRYVEIDIIDEHNGGGLKKVADVGERLTVVVEGESSGYGDVEGEYEILAYNELESNGLKYLTPRQEYSDPASPYRLVLRQIGE